MASSRVEVVDSTSLRRRPLIVPSGEKRTSTSANTGESRKAHNTKKRKRRIIFRRREKAIKWIPKG
jgi:hypothetical protein